MNRINTGIGHLPLVQLREGADGSLGDSAIRQLAGTINNVIGALNGGLRIGDGSANSGAGNLAGIILRVIFPSVADTEIVMPHDLERVPVLAIPIWKDKAAHLYSKRSAAEAWGDGTRAYLTCDTASAKMLVLLM